MDFEHHNELQLLEALAAEPETSQADLAARLGIAVGTVNWYLKRMSAKGWITVKRIGRWRWRYLLTPEGVREKTTLAGKYLEASFIIYRRTRAQARQLLTEVQQAGYSQVVLAADGDLADICRLTCLELGVAVLPATSAPAGCPILTVAGTQLAVSLPPHSSGEEADNNQGATHGLA